MTRVDEAVDTIRQMVIKRQYNSEGYLPSEGELCELLGVSRATIREAVRTLEVRGFVKRIHGKGICVADGCVGTMAQSIRDMIDKHDMSWQDVMETRTIIEIRAARLAIDRVDAIELKALKKLVREMEKSTVADAGYVKNDLTFHKKLVACSKNEMLVAIVEAYSEWLSDLIQKSYQTVVNVESITHFHRNIYEALERKDKDGITKAMKEHLTTTATNIECGFNQDLL